jgi:hypothetical protein
MAQTPRLFRGPETEEAFVADRQRFWFSFTKFTAWMVVLVVLVLILMTVFLV